MRALTSYITPVPLALTLALAALLGCPPLGASAGEASAEAEKTPPPNMSEADMTVPTHTPEGHELATLAGGCFWGVEELLRELPGVIDTEVGYTGGDVASPTYSDVKTGRSGHAEAVQIAFDPARLSYADLLRFFFRLHDPTTKNRQGNDVGTQYRSAIFFHSEAQRAVAAQVKAEVDASGKWPAPVVTELVPAQPFTAAEDYHQDYLQRVPNGYTCHFLRE